MGVSLVIALLLLFVLTIVGIASMSGISMQERMTSNAVAQARAFEAASAGVANALEFRDAALEQSGFSCGFSANGDWFWPAGGFQEIVGVGEFVGDGEVRLSQRLYCLEYEDLSTAFSGRQLFVLSRGEALSGGEVISTRDIEVRVDRIGGPIGSLCNASPWCFPINPDLDLDEENCPGPDSRDFCSCNFGRGTGNDPSTNPFSAANSNFRVVGQEYPDQGVGPAVALPPGHLLALQCAISQGDTLESCETNNLSTGGCQRIDNYVGGLQETTDFGSPWSDPLLTYNFLFDLLEKADYLVAPSDLQSRVEFPLDNDSLDSGSYNNWTVNPGNIAYNGFDPSGNFDFGTGVHYIAGDADFSGTISGSGVLVVEGRMDWSGTNQFDGLIIVLGGEAKIGGGGSGGDSGGSVVVLDLATKPSTYVWTGTEPETAPSFGSNFSVEVGGGGNAEFTFNCQNLWDTYDLIYPGRTPSIYEPIEDSLWAPNCDPTATEAPSGTRAAIVSWRENIGWRSDDRFIGAQ